MEKTTGALSEFITSKTKEHWDDTQTPWLLADVAPALREEGFDYKALIAPLTLKQFAAGMSGKVKVIQHSTHKAQIGLVPDGATYSFEQKASEPKGGSKDEPGPKHPPRSNKYVVLNFLQALSSLSDEDLEKVVVPTSVLAKLLKEK
jgi:hypothetical protein